jgi:hypothetical protein
MSLPPNSLIEPRTQQVNARSASPLPFSSCTSSLFTLPGEIRNLIYKYALTTEHGISLLPSNRDRPKQLSARGPDDCTQPAEADSSQGGFNQLKFIGRQLYHETAGTEIKFNEV